MCLVCRETRLTEAIDNICERILQYNVHAERPGSLRYAKVRTVWRREITSVPCIASQSSIFRSRFPKSLQISDFVAGRQSDHDDSEEPGPQRGEGGAGSPVWDVGWAVCGGVRHEETGGFNRVNRVKSLSSEGTSVTRSYSLSNTQSAALTNLQKLCCKKYTKLCVSMCVFCQCETMLEQYEDVVEEWYFHHQDQRLENFLCQEHVLKTSEQGRRLLPHSQLLTNTHRL